ncbi:MAG: tRNA 5-methylaminomethyl-2-thiouridine biosynthesis bifunctional protein MnmC [uncultured Thiotrichaceae bacterium]|uniref:tRNA 5-methylaminomethyl-2-thiouridine biosynthesis bifunctional protein MnmC n=1 Tax=uncultured Thiotrichaceae bacterium TaxID=298394 RepID=A0A6S6T2K0_9GAMM|nr:MAG: tRNA 5-methylaminomethyl-2-thiouridine biosynthesis bifunctional protein MnmC [uncultured Thiotrichaceae bacterium]
MEEITPACLGWDIDKCLYANDFNDYYHSKLDASAESAYVFLEGNQLPENWLGVEKFVIAELGFGTGLNFLVTWHEWLKKGHSHQHLHYLAIEKHPLKSESLRLLLEQYPQLAEYAHELLENYPPLLTGMHTIKLADGQITLTLCFMDVVVALEELVADVDCWYLDGFSPVSNPAMWCEKLMRQIAALSRPGKTTLATFTAASAVRRNLQAAGFVVSKRKGFGRKREMLIANYPEPAVHTDPLSPWYSLPVAYNLNTGTMDDKRTALIIGGGIAGCQSARALAERGWKVRLLERHAELAQEASGNKAGVLTPKMTARLDWGERFYRQAFLYANRQLQRLKQAHNDLQWDACGALQLNHSEREAKRWAALCDRNLPADFIRLLNAEEAGQVAGLPLDFGGSYFPDGGWVNPQSLCEVLVRHENIEVLSDTSVLTLKKAGEQWLVCGEYEDLAPADAVIIANGKDIRRFTEAVALPFVPVRGQTSYAASTDITRSLKVTLGHEGYMTPAINEQHIFGATFERENESVILSGQSDEQNWQQLHEHLPQLASQLRSVGSSHAALRMTTPDRYPYVGPLADNERYFDNYADLRYGRVNQVYPPATYVEGLYVAGGFGSRGLTTSALATALLAALINGEPLPVEKSLYCKLHPSRFLIRHIRKNRE